MPADTGPAGRKVIVTGAAGGIGRAIVDALAATGARSPPATRPALRLPTLAGAATTAAFDVRDQAGVRAGVHEAIEALGGCDAVVANAGIVDTIHRAERFSDEDWRKDIETNLYGAFYVAQAAFEALAESGDGRVVLISSVGGRDRDPGPGRLRRFEGRARRHGADARRASGRRAGSAATS